MRSITVHFVALVILGVACPLSRSQTGSDIIRLSEGAQSSDNQRFAVVQELTRLRRQLEVLEKRIAALESQPNLAAPAPVPARLVPVPAPPPAPPQGVVAELEFEPPLVAAIMIIGNTNTPDSSILKLIPLFPGQVIRDKELREAERNLRATGRFYVDPRKGIGPNVQVVEANGRWKNLLVTVKE